MSVLVIAEHDNQRAEGRDPERGHRRARGRRQGRRRRAPAGRRQRLPRGRRGGGAGRRRGKGAARRRRRPTIMASPKTWRRWSCSSPRTTAMCWRRRRPPGKNMMPRVAALLDVMQISDISAVVSADTFVRPIYAGNALATVQSKDPIKVITVRGTAFAPAEASGGSAQRSRRSRRPGAAGISEFVRAELSKSERPELTSARVIISGGRGMQSGDNFHSAGEGRRQARRGGRRVARRGRCRVRAERLSGRADRQDRRAGALYRGRHLGRDPASRRA